MNRYRHTQEHTGSVRSPACKLAGRVLLLSRILNLEETEPSVAFIFAMQAVPSGAKCKAVPPLVCRDFYNLNAIFVDTLCLSSDAT